MPRIPVVFYLPNLLGYARIALAFVGLHCAIVSLPSTFVSDTKDSSVDAVPSPGLCLLIWILSAFLDLFDGLAARRLNQCSRFGVILDILADNILRTVTWIATAIIALLSAVFEMESNIDAGEKSKQTITLKSAATVFVACSIICLEWATMLCTQLKTAEDGNHWKSQNGFIHHVSSTCSNGKGQAMSAHAEPPALVSEIFRNNFRSPLGVLSIYGLFSCGLWTYGSHIKQIRSAIPYFKWWWALAVLGRLLSIQVEIWLCWSYLRSVLSGDENKRK